MVEGTPDLRGNKELVDEACALERQIAATPAFTRKGLDGKKRVVKRATFDDDDGILAMILQLDAERVAAAR
jgi:hypothetical protein